MKSDSLLDESSAKLIDSLMESGRFHSRKDVVHEGLRLLDEREKARKAEVERFRVAVQEGIDSGDYKPADEVFAELRKKFGDMPKARSR